MATSQPCFPEEKATLLPSTPQFPLNLQGLNEHLLSVKYGLRPAEDAERNGTCSVLRSQLARLECGEAKCVQDKYPKNSASRQNIGLLLLSYMLKNKTKIK